MPEQSLYLLKIIGVFGIVLVIGWYQLRSVERLRREDELKKQKQLEEAIKAKTDEDDV